MTQPNQSTGGGWARSFSAFTRQNRYLRVILALALVLAVATSLWFATPTEAFDINFPTLPSSGTVNNSYLFTTQLCVATSELIPIQSVALYIYKADDRTNYQAYASLPINMASVTYSHAQTGGGIIGVNAIPGAVWLWGYGYGYADWQGQGYRFFPGPGGYGYGYSGYGGPTSMTYNIEWVSPAGWPVGTYKIEIRVLTTTGTTFIKTSSPFSLSAAAAPPQSPTPTQVEEMTTPAAAAAVEQMTTQQAATVLEQVSTDKAAEIIATVSTEKAADIVETVTTAKAAAIVDQVSTTTAATIMEQVIPTRAAEIIEQVDINKATGIVEQVTATTATAIVQEVETTKAAEIVEQVTITRAVSIVENVTTTKAAGIVEQVTTDKAASIIEQVTTAKAASIFEQVTTTKAADVIEQVSTAKSADIMQQVEPTKAAAIMQNLTTEKLTNTIPAMSETSLIERLPGLTTDKLYSIDIKVLLSAMPNAPREQLSSETLPTVVGDKPIVIATTPSGQEYLIIQTAQGQFVKAIGTPPPVDELLIKTRQVQTNVKTKLEVFDTAPAGLSALAADQIVRAYITIDFDQATLDNIEIGHMTFKVEKDWLEKNSIHKWSVTLNRFDTESKQWMALPTKRIKEDATDIYYTAIITKFSSFAITGSKNVPALSFDTANLKITPATAKTGETVTITADVKNVSDVPGTFAATLWINSTIETGKNIYLNAGETKPVSFSVTRGTEGTYQVRIDKLTGSFTVSKAPPPPVPATFSVGKLSIAPAAVDAGQNVLVSVLISNTGDLSGSYNVTLKINDAVAATMDVTLAGKASQTITFTTSRDTEGTYSVDVNGLKGTFTVNPATPVTPPVTPINWPLIGGIIAAVIAIIVVVILTIRRERARRALS